MDKLTFILDHLNYRAYLLCTMSTSSGSPRQPQLSFLLALALVAGVAGCQTSDGAERHAAPPAALVKLETLQNTQLQDTTEYVATLKSRSSIVLQPQVDGQLVKIFVKSGDVVE